MSAHVRIRAPRKPINSDCSLTPAELAKGMHHWYQMDVKDAYRAACLLLVGSSSNMGYSEVMARIGQVHGIPEVDDDTAKEVFQAWKEAIG